MSETKIDFERIPGLEHIVRAPVDEYDDPKVMTDVLEATLDSCLKNGDSRIIVDLKNIEYPSTRLIALLIEATSRARRAQGDLKIINLVHTGKTNLARFSPTSFLTIEEDEALAFQDFDEPEAKTTEEIIPADEEDLGSEPFAQPMERQATQPEPDYKITPPPPVSEPRIMIEEEELTSPVDIADDPIIERIETTFENIEGKADFPETNNKAIAAKVDKKRKPKRDQLSIKSDPKNLYAICDFVTQYAEEAGFDSKEIGKTKIAVYEACLNIIEHAYHSKPDSTIDVSVEYDFDKFVIEIKDYGIGFEGFDSKNYDVMSAMDGRQTGGFGLYIIRRSMDEVGYKADDRNGNVLKMVKYLNSKS